MTYDVHGGGMGYGRVNCRRSVSMLIIIVMFVCHPSLWSLASCELVSSKYYIIFVSVEAI
jgi:hypothetical protein